MRITMIFGAVGAFLAAALVGGTVIGSTLATDEASDDATGTTTGAGAYCEVFFDAFAGELGVTRDELLAAGQAAANAALDAAVAAGDVSEERAASVRERIAEADATDCNGLGHAFGRGLGGPHHGMARRVLGGDALEAAADTLGIESAELIDQIADAGSLEAVADGQGASYDELKAAVLDAVQADLDAAVAEGLPQERADAAIERLTVWLDGGGELGELRHGRGSFGPGHGPWHGGDGDDEDAEAPAS